MPQPFRILLALVVSLCAAAAACAHPVLNTVAIVHINPDGAVSIRVIHDGLAYALNDTSAQVADAQMFELLNGPEDQLAAAFEDGLARFSSGFQFTVDGIPLQRTVIESPSLDGVRRWEIENPTRRLPCKLAFEVHAVIPRGTHMISLRFPMVFGDVLLSVDRPGHEPIYLPITPAEQVPPMQVVIGEPDAAADAHPPAAADPIGSLATAWRYIKLGFVHIIPEGYDHALFVLGLFLLTPRVKTLFWQISAFTVAHSITLTLATLGIATIPAVVVEPTIALTIAFIAVENLVIKEPKPWRAGIAFLFGLVHGLGFASALHDVGLPPGQLASALIAFNVGVECGHITVLGLAFLLLGWARARPWYRARVAIPISLLIAAVSLFWAVDRVLSPS